MKGLRRGFLFAVFSCFAISRVLAQAECPDIVRTALQTAGESCAAIARNQTCYGNVQVEALPQSWATDFQFAALGDLVDVAALQTLNLSSQVEQDGIWGVALMSLQANLPDTVPGQNVTFVVFGQVNITSDTVVTAAPVQLEVSAVSSANIRSFPSTDGAILGSLTTGETIIADGRLADGSWLRVRREQGGAGWVSATLLTSTSDVTTLSVVDEPTAPVFGPMQAFYFQAGVGDAPCAEAPDSGILIQTPQGAGQITLSVNQVDIQVGSTIYMQAQPNGDMVVYVVEGRITVTALGTSVIALAGTRVRIPIDNNLQPIGAPIGPEAYDSAAVANLPISLLPTTITIADPLTPEQIQSASNLPQSGTWAISVTATDCGVESEDSTTIGVTVAEDGSTISLEDGTVLTRTSPDNYAFNGDGTQMTLQVVSPIFMTQFIDTGLGCTAQNALSFIG